jgi:hypothetical protein
MRLDNEATEAERSLPFRADLVTEPINRFG